MILVVKKVDLIYRARGQENNCKSRVSIVIMDRKVLQERIYFITKSITNEDVLLHPAI